ncbi:MAG: hypothetical protein ABGY43_04320 [bacterium]|jgi:hypothetical protein|nr:hypothetical protein [Gammaproteobacteria bacterium]HIL82743.1 hypothetical protein [Pseudomonadales bacterium]
MTSNTIFFTVTLAALFALPLSAGENQQEPVPTPDSSGQIDPILDEDIEPADVSKEQTSEPLPELSSKQSSKPAPQGGNLRARDIGDAFKNFQPSEEISADNAVTFPVDI